MPDHRRTGSSGQQLDLNLHVAREVDPAGADLHERVSPVELPPADQATIDEADVGVIVSRTASQSRAFQAAA